MTNLFVLNYYLSDNQNSRNYWLNHVLGIKKTSQSVKLFKNNKKKNYKLSHNYKINEYYKDKFFLYFLKKEIFYTKLKYSRVPQFDTSSGAAASFMSGMYGFMVSEKFGFELIDSADFLFMFIYLCLFIWAIITFHVFFNSNENIFKNLYIIIKSFN